MADTSARPPAYRGRSSASNRARSVRLSDGYMWFTFSPLTRDYAPVKYGDWSQQTSSKMARSYTFNGNMIVWKGIFGPQRVEKTDESLAMKHCCNSSKSLLRRSPFQLGKRFSRQKRESRFATIISRNGNSIATFGNGKESHWFFTVFVTRPSV